MPTNQNIFRLDIAMNDFLLVGILQSGGKLHDIIDNRIEGQACATRIALTHRSIGRVIHLQLMYNALDAKYKHAHDIRMSKAGNGARFIQKRSNILAFQTRMKYLYRSLGIEKHVLTQVDFGEASLT